MEEGGGGELFVKVYIKLGEKRREGGEEENGGGERRKEEKEEETEAVCSYLRTSC